MQKKASYDFYLVLATSLVLFVISAIFIYAMLAFKIAEIDQMEPALKHRFMERMNTLVSPFLMALILILGVCVPKRLLPTAWLNRFALALGLLAVATSLFLDVKTGLMAVVVVSLFLQGAVLLMALAGSRRLHFEKKGYWVRLGSSLMHFGLLLFILDLFVRTDSSLHLPLFWVTTGATVLGMIFCFYAPAVAAGIKRLFMAVLP